MENELIQSLVSEASQKIDKTRENQVISQLEKFGYKFESRFHFIEFLKTRCQLTCKFKANSLYADGQLVATWYDTVETEIKTNDKGEIFITSICGKPPAINL